MDIYGAKLPRIHARNALDVQAKLEKICSYLGIPPTIDEIYAWNDAPERTFADIRRVIEEANV